MSVPPVKRLLRDGAGFAEDARPGADVALAQGQDQFRQSHWCGIRVLCVAAGQILTMSSSHRSDRRIALEIANVSPLALASPWVHVGKSSNCFWSVPLETLPRSSP